MSVSEEKEDSYQDSDEQDAAARIFLASKVAVVEQLLAAGVDKDAKDGVRGGYDEGCG